MRNKKNIDIKVVHKLFSDNRWEFSEKIKIYLESGIHVILDRYAFSGVAFSSANGMTIEECKVDDSGLIAPDVVFFLDMAPSELMKRQGFGEERYETEKFQEKVLDVYRRLEDSSWVKIDACKSIDDVESDVKGKIDSLLKETREPFRYLWMGTNQYQERNKE